MKRGVIVLSCVLLLLIAATVNAEQKLLITDILDAWQFEAEAAFDYMHSSNDFELNFFGLSRGTDTRNSFGSTYKLGLGVGYGLELSAGIPYVNYNNEKFEASVNHIPQYFTNDGLGDFVFGVKYRLYGDAKKSLAVVTGLDVKFDTKEKVDARSGTTDFRPYVAASTVVNNFRPYAWYRASIRSHGGTDSHFVGLGTEYEINKYVTLKPAFTAEFIVANYLKSYESYNFSIESYLRVYQNFYLLPRFSVGFTTDANSKDGIEHMDTSAATYAGGLSLYYLFN